MKEEETKKKIKDPVPRTVYDEPYIERALSHLSLLLYYCVSHSIALRANQRYNVRLARTGGTFGDGWD